MISREDLNAHLLSSEYAVRGPIVQRARQLEAEGKKVIYCNIGNPQALKQRPLSFVRQMLSLLEYPELLRHQELLSSYGKDVVKRVEEILRTHPEGVGAYSESPGLAFVREAVAGFIERRDGIKASADHIILTDGASKGAQSVLLALLKEERDGFMIPIPQYPLYSASIELYGRRQIGYYLDEQNGWQLNEESLTESLKKATAAGTHPVGIVVINPGNPTGAVLSAENIRMVVGFAKRHGLSIIADEVYQENVYGPRLKFFSFAKVMHEMGESGVSLFSLHSISKGFLGECGHRGGYLEFRNIPDDVLAEFVKLQSISLCANVIGQIAVYAMVAPPVPGEESYALYVRERDEVLADLRERAEILASGVNGIDGMSMNVPRGAMYAFIRIELPPERGIHPETMPPGERASYEAKRDSEYCLSLLEETGICVIPGSGFGQRAGTLHFRTTFLPPRVEIEDMVKKLKAFHERYVRELVVA